VASPPASSAAPRDERRCYFEDVVVGAPLDTPGLTLTEAHVAFYDGLTGGRPGERPGQVPDLLPLCISSGLGWRVPQPPLAVLAFMGFEWKFHLPLHVGDTIRSRSRTAAKRSMKEGGIIFEERDILNQRGEVVQSGRLTLLVAKRSAA
jgi:Acyl dehydratase